MVRHASGYRSAAYSRRENRKVRRTWRYNFRVKATLGRSSLPELSPMPIWAPGSASGKGGVGGKSDLAGERGGARAQRRATLALASGGPPKTWRSSPPRPGAAEP
jgi:hypothetical protein